ncbi:MAG: ABC transporter substrate-binding protein [Burkholderiales bacterium]
MLTKTLTLGAALLFAAAGAFAQPKEIKIGVIYDLTGPFAGGGSEANYLGTKAVIDMFNEKGGVEGYRINPIYVDAQSKVDVAINEAERLINQEKVDMIMGVYSSAQCVPMAGRIDAAKKFMWANVCISSAVFKGKNLQYVFRPQPHSDQFGEASCDYLKEHAQRKFGTTPDKLKVAIIYEDGPYGAGVAAGNESQCKKNGINIVLKEGYAATAPDLSSLVTKLRRAQPDVLLHTGYNPDITLFLRQSKEQNFKFKAMIGHGAGHSQIDRLRGTFGDDVNYFHSIDPVAAQLLDPKTLKPGMGDLTREMVKRYQAVKGPGELPPHTSMGFTNTWIFLADVLPRAIKKHGGIGSEALRRAAMETDIPAGGTPSGYGVKFYPPGHAMAGQNERSTPVIMQFVNGRSYIAWPTAIRTTDPMLPLPKGHAFAR